jgi:hypothetical protein
LDKDGIAIIENWATTITKQFTREVLANDLKVKDFYEMAKQQYETAIKEAYGGIKEGGSPSDEYLKLRFETCKKMMALAGYRLADLLNNYVK